MVTFSPTFEFSVLVLRFGSSSTLSYDVTFLCLTYLVPLKDILYLVTLKAGYTIHVATVKNMILKSDDIHLILLNYRSTPISAE